MAVTPLGVASGIIIGATGGILVQRYRYRLDRRQTVKMWFSNSLGLIARVEHLGRRVTEFQTETNTEKLRSELEPLSEEIKQHAGGAPDGVSLEARDRMNNLANIANGLVIITEQGDDASPAELLSILQQSAKQRDEPTPDIEQVNQLIAGIDTESIHEKLPTEDIDYDEEMLDDILVELTDETQETMQIQSVEDALNFDFGAVNEVIDGLDVVDDVMDGTMREYVRVWTLDVTEGLYDEMETRRDRV
ncbi:hypothetical protein [Haloferax denitrificans]|uniref:hypothetical protein n=1 Tax=Haloferax denitrificans TaxID=35745 RepID=UPI003C6EF389